MDNTITIESITRELTDGLTYTKKQIEEIQKWLIAYMFANRLSLRELSERCWENSDNIFNEIF